ncbi:hypothetical protein G4Y79_10905 [Phototrophicus methaneseepsis]|uniref:Uncharacterized protein n=1 Tax=Phototrophicus methaneseepsis TaxID=2710758 RepID=A0A7S8EDA2_9CHLR|nr:hypothetical protein [Phototrophicus methaneseepsis]QPC84850.1 hypothetical protein G4Y79_10905 [Phototrophicus methaneseepsis]
MRRVLLLSLLLLMTGVAAVQSETGGIWDVFLQRGAGENGSDALIFVDGLTGNSQTVSVQGERYTPLRDGILFYDASQRRILIARPDQTVEPHPFIRMDAEARRIDWIVSEDGRAIAWTLTYGTPEAITTITSVITPEIPRPQLVLEDGPQVGVRALPIAFNETHSLLYMDTYPDGLERYVAYKLYAGLFQLDLSTGETSPLPGEPGCFCGAGVRRDKFVRLGLSGDLSGFDVHYFDLTSGQDRHIDAIRLSNFTQAGDVLVTEDGTLAVYALSDVSDFGTPEQSIRTVFMLIDLLSMEQRPLTEPITTYVHPLLWTEDNSAILFTSTQRDGTWKVSLDTGELLKVAEATYLGSIQG